MVLHAVESESERKTWPYCWCIDLGRTSARLQIVQPHNFVAARNCEDPLCRAREPDYIFRCQEIMGPPVIQRHFQVRRHDERIEGKGCSSSFKRVIRVKRLFFPNARIVGKFLANPISLRYYWLWGFNRSKWLTKQKFMLEMRDIWDTKTNTWNPIFLGGGEGVQNWLFRRAIFFNAFTKGRSALEVFFKSWFLLAIVIGFP